MTYTSTAVRLQNLLASEGDTDGDRDVDTVDLTGMIMNYTGAIGSGTTWLTGDTNGDGDTDTVDLTTAIINFTGATMPPVNNVPTLDPISDVTIDEDAPQQTVGLTGITAGDGESQVLKVTATSDNPGLIPNPAVAYTSAASGGSLSFTPVPDASGNATITVTVEDGGLDNNLATPEDNATQSRTFEVTVNPVNDAPTLIQPDNLTIDEDAPEQTVQLAGITAGGGEAQPLRIYASNTSVLAAYELNTAGASGAFDSSGNGKHGGGQGAFPVGDRHGVAGQSLAFNGTNDELVFDTPFPFNAKADRSLSFWMNTPADKYAAVLWGRENDADKNRFHLYVNGSNTTATIGLDYRGNDGIRRPIFDKVLAGDTSGNATVDFTANKWGFVTLTRQENTYSIYLNGELKETWLIQTLNSQLLRDGKLLDEDLATTLRARWMIFSFMIELLLRMK